MWDSIGNVRHVKKYPWGAVGVVLVLLCACVAPLADGNLLPVAPEPAQIVATPTRVRPAATRVRPTATAVPTPLVDTVAVAIVQVDSLRTRAFPGTDYAVLWSNQRSDVLYVAGDASGAQNAWLPVYVVGKGYGWVAARYVRLEQRPAAGADYAVWLEHVHDKAVVWVMPTAAAFTSTTAAPAATAVPPPVVQVPESPASVPAGDSITRSYRWQFNGEWNWEIVIPRALYEDYRRLPRPRTRNYSIYATHPLDDVYIGGLVDSIREAALEAGYSDDQTVEFAAAFVQSLPYTVDSVTTSFDEYPRYPIETLVDNGGDCEDTSILLAAIVDKLGYGVALIMPPAHVAVGIAGEESMPGRYWEYDGTKYFYLETTGQGFQIGEVPSVYSKATAHVYPIRPVAILMHDWVAKWSGNQLAVKITVQNGGTAITNRASVLAGFESDGLIYNQEDSGLFSVAAGTDTIVNLKVNVPRDRHMRLLVQILNHGEVVDQSYGDWIDK